VPILTFNNQAFWVDFSYVPPLDFALTNAGAVADTTPYSGCAPSTLSADLKVHIPSVMFQGSSYWLDLTYAQGVTLTVAGAGANQQATLIYHCCQHGVRISKEDD
jgi:hypothetical protein